MERKQEYEDKIKHLEQAYYQRKLEYQEKLNELRHRYDNMWFIQDMSAPTSYLPKMGAKIAQYVRQWDNKVVQEDEIDDLFAEIQDYQNQEYLASGKRLKTIEFRKTYTDGNKTLSICTPIKSGYGEYVTFLTLTKIQGEYTHKSITL